MDTKSLKSKVPHDFGFYAILTNPRIGFERLAEILVQENVSFIQLRIKTKQHNYNCSNIDDFILKTAKNLRAITKNTSSKFIINDDPYLALEVNADGVHIGQNDLDYLETRKIVGNKMIIGLSTHNIQQVQEANILRPDYIGMGPVYKTPTKQIADPALGINGLKEMMSYNKLPFLALGGINHSNVKNIFRLGVKNISFVRPIDEAKTENEVIEKLRNIFAK
jgi:thiamine-phosphate pyrophosphorylase